MTKEEIIQKAHEILEETKNNIENYEIERKIIFNLIEYENIEMLESIINLYSKINKLEQESQKYNEIKTILEDLKIQQTRKCDNCKITHLFILTDKNNESYTFFTRENAKKYLEENKEIFEENTEIKVSKNKDIDLERLINITI